MSAIPLVLLLIGAATLGVLLLFDYLNGRRSKPTIIGLHMLLGAGSLEVVAMLLRGISEGGVTTAGRVPQFAAGLVAFALWSGLMVPLIGRRSRGVMNGAMLIHVAASASGVVLCLLWVARLR